VSVTTNGLPLVRPDGIFWKTLKEHSPDKIHVTLHNPDSEKELNRVLMEIRTLEKVVGVTAGCNLLVADSKIEACKRAYETLRRFMTPKQIILVPMRYGDTPGLARFASVSRHDPFQAPCCLLECKRPDNFISVSWDKKVNFCSYAGGKHPLETLDYDGLMKALDKVEFKTCMNHENLQGILHNALNVNRLICRG
jgi:hypothetical protein